MCIVLLTTAHPKYALVVLDNRDEYILRPTSRPHWWSPTTSSSSTTTTPPPQPPHGPTTTHNHPASNNDADGGSILSSRDLQRSERGTWLGLTRAGNFAVLTNYRETDPHSAAHPVAGPRSRGGMVTAWLGADPAESTQEFVGRMLVEDEGGVGGVRGVGGFSLICGKLRRRGGISGQAGGGEKGEEKGRCIEPLAIISNRCDHAAQVPWICGERGSLYGLSNAIYREPGEEGEGASLWPKIRQGRALLKEAMARAITEDATDDEFISSLFHILDTDNFPPDHTIDLEQGIPFLKNSIFIPAFGGLERQQEMREARERGLVRQTTTHPNESRAAAETLKIAARPDEQPCNGFETGLYGTQRQTVILVDWDGKVTYVERALFDGYGNPIPRGEGDAKFEFKVEGWDEAPEVDTRS